MLLRYSTYPGRRSRSPSHREPRSAHRTAHRHSDSRSICRMARKLSATTCSPISGTGTSILGSDCCRARMVLGTEVAMIECRMCYVEGRERKS